MMVEVTFDPPAYQECEKLLLHYRVAQSLVCMRVCVCACVCVRVCVCARARVCVCVNKYA